jgi:hypothetical protein
MRRHASLLRKVFVIFVASYVIYRLVPTKDLRYDLTLGSARRGTRHRQQEKYDSCHVHRGHPSGTPGKGNVSVKLRFEAWIIFIARPSLFIG